MNQPLEVNQPSFVLPLSLQDHLSVFALPNGAHLIRGNIPSEGDMPSKVENHILVAKAAEFAMQKAICNPKIKNDNRKWPAFQGWVCLFVNPPTKYQEADYQTVCAEETPVAASEESIIDFKAKFNGDDQE